MLFFKTFRIFQGFEHRHSEKSSFFSPALLICFLILITLFLMHMKHCCSRLHIWARLLLHQPLVSGLLLHRAISAENDTQSICDTQILASLSLIPCAFFLPTNIPASNHMYQNTQYQPCLYGNLYTKGHKFNQCQEPCS